MRARIRFRAQPSSAPLAFFAAMVMLAVLSGCGRGARKTAANIPAPPSRAHVAPARIGSTETGVASWYGNPYHGRPTASGEIYDMEKLTAAHRTLPFETWLDVRNLSNGKHVEVRVTDRGPFIDGRVIDLSLAAAREIDMVRSGTTRVRLKVIAPPKNVAQNQPTAPSGQVRQLPAADLPDTSSPALAPENRSSPPAKPISSAGPATTISPDADPPDSLGPIVPPIVQQHASCMPAPADALPSTVPPPKSHYTVQAGAFADLNRAAALCDLIAAQLETPTVVRVAGPTGPPSLWRVLVGRSLSIEEASGLAAKVRKVAGDALVVAEPDTPVAPDNP